MNLTDTDILLGGLSVGHDMTIHIKSTFHVRVNLVLLESATFITSQRAVAPQQPWPHITLHLKWSKCVLHNTRHADFKLVKLWNLHPKLLTVEDLVAAPVSMNEQLYNRAIA